MIQKSPTTALMLCVILTKGISGFSFSNVYVQSNPTEYIKYGSPSESSATPEIARISATPVESIPIETVQGLITPCVTPCIISNTAETPQARANVITYRSSNSNVPIILTQKDDAASYLYSYTVYDEQTGDRKSQSEHSDGAVVQGQYSLIEPNGWRREVTYTADDLKGFNAVVSNISPDIKAVTNKSNKDKKEEPTQPCEDVKGEQLRIKPQETQKATKVNEKKDHSYELSESHSKSREESAEELVTTPQEIVTIGKEMTTVLPVIIEDITKEAESETLQNYNVVPYNEIIKCLQSKIRGLNTENHTSLDASPLTYILLPTLGIKPC
ncbi:unnamed protein product [Parnassius apollo]|uniref:(apollo) hypothetical protein n=1 Tax=Parnassius apollo TaxID=110799 RepID=A0A8S3W5D0_PARAO|nr:unnamed protein product [Parnassius apollo]